MKKISPSKDAKVRYISGQVEKKRLRDQKQREFYNIVAETLNANAVMIADLSARMVCLENLFLETNPDFTPEDLRMRVAEVVKKAYPAPEKKEVVDVGKA